jgi:peptidoglycan/LPS O-acetylase OafA/YrhL
MIYRAEIDGLRALAVAGVVGFHIAPEYVKSGWIGVDIFFVISGFLITQVLLNQKGSLFNKLLAFYERRLRRLLLPLLIVIFVSQLAAPFFLTPAELIQFSNSVIASLFFVANLYFMQTVNYFSPSSEYIPLLHMWSLGVEEQFYLFFPFALFFLRRVFGTQILLLSLMAIAVLSFILTFTEYFSQHIIFYSLLTRIWELLAGAFIQLVSTHPRKSQIVRFIGNCGLCIAFASLFASTAYIGPKTLLFLSVIGTSCFLLAVGSDSLANRILKIKPFVLLGLISYGTYLWHYPILSFLHHATFGTPNLWQMAAAVALAYLFGLVSWKFVEQPTRDPKRVQLTTFWTLVLMFALPAVFLAGLSSQQLGFKMVYASDVINRASTITGDKQDRKRLTGKNKCHFNNLTRNDPRLGDPHLGNCNGGGDNNLENPKIAVFGDSVAADKAVALRANNISTFQITGAGCPLLPQKKSQDYKNCNQIFETFLKLKPKVPLLIAGDIPSNMITASYIEDLLRFWSREGAVVYFMSPMPEFLHFEKKYVMGDLSEIKISLEKAALFRRALSKIIIPKNIIVLDSYSLLCRKNEQCWEVDDGLTVVDQYHLSQVGAKLFGKALTKIIDLD